MPIKREQRVLTIHRLLERHRRGGPEVTVPSIITALEEDFGEGFAGKTIRRDLHWMRDEAKLPLSFCQSSNGWSYHGTPQLQTASMELLLSTRNALTLLLARQSLEQYQGTPFYGLLKPMFERILAAVPATDRHDFQLLTEKIRFEGPIEAEIPDPLWWAIRDALQQEVTLNMQYRSGRTGEVSARRVDPYGLVILDRQWRLIGWDHGHKDVRVFLVSRMAEAQASDDWFKPKRGFDLSRYLADAVGGEQATGRALQVQLRFTKEASARGVDQHWHANESRKHDKTGRLVVSFKTAALFKVKRQVLSWGGDLEVLKPASLRKEIAEAAQKMAKQHQSK